MTLRLAVLGDSIGFGIGATRTADTLAPRLAAALLAAGLPADARVFAVPGARSADLVRQVTSVASWPPDLALIVIGANDLTHFVPAEQAAASLGRVVRSLRELSAQVLLAPAPDLSIVPHVPPPMRPLVRLFCHDRFHPSSAGYAVIAQALTPALLAAAGELGSAGRAS